MVLARSKRKVVEDLEDDDVQIVTPSTPKRKTTTKNVTKKIMMKKKEGKTKEEKKHWKDADVEVMIALREEMEPEFFKNAKKQGMSNVSVVSVSPLAPELPFPLMREERAVREIDPCTLWVRTNILGCKGNHHSFLPLSVQTHDDYVFIHKPQLKFSNKT